MDAGLQERPSKSSQPETYRPPLSSNIVSTSLIKLIEPTRKLQAQQRLSFGAADDESHDITLFCAGDLALAERRCIAVVGTRKVSVDGAKRARRLARELAAAGVVVVSGLAEGIDTEALSTAIEEKGRTIAVIGTPLDKAYPAGNRRLQESIYRDHLLVSQFPLGTRVFQSNFPQRNRVMAAMSDATVIIEASDTSGTLHQAAECRRLGRWLFIAKSIVDDSRLRWPQSFLKYERTGVLTSTDELLSTVYGEAPCR